MVLFTLESWEFDSYEGELEVIETGICENPNDEDDDLITCKSSEDINMLKNEFETFQLR